ncbi:MAG: YhgE/Pip domain-containing protein [Blautia marasmi]
MKNIWKIFRSDISHIKNNVIALIVILGLTVVPALYAWFNIAASWDPYSNTGGIKVAVANADEGYESSIAPIKINMGDTVISNLRANEQMDWVFTGKKKAVEGVRSGKYYAAIVIPKSFSRDMMTVFSDDVTHSKLVYYSNQKENAIAPKVTDKGADSIRSQIDEIFTKTISQIGLDVMNSLSSYLDQDGTKTMIGNLAGNTENSADDLRGLASTMTAFSDMMDSMQGILDTTSSLLEQSGRVQIPDWMCLVMPGTALTV